MIPIGRNEVRLGLWSFLTLIVISLGGPSVYGHIAEMQGGSVGTDSHEPKKIVEIYLEAVKRGELKIFDRVLDESMLIPSKVEYVYELDSTRKTIRVYSKLKQPMPLPGRQDCKVRAVSSTLDGDGHIVDTEAHVWPE